MHKIWPKLLLALASVVITLIALEAAYRMKLYFTIGHLPLGMSETYVVANDIESVADDELGYDLLPNKHTVSVRVTKGKPVLYYERFTNELGNYGPGKEYYETAELKIAVFGDSCTAVGGKGVWPTVLERRLMDELGRSVCILNFARDGYGILQIFDMAARKVPEFRPDAVLIGFISDDLTRARLPVRRAEVDVQTSFLDPAVTKSWCEQMIQSEDPADPLLSKLNENFRRAKAEATPIDYLTLRASLLYNRLVWEDPFFHRPEKATNPRITYSSFAEDPQFLAAVERLEELQIPYYLIHLPEYGELKSGRYRLRAQEKKLLASLEQITGRKVVSLVQSARELREVESLFHYPYDLHPSAKGLEFYAKGVHQALRGELEKWARQPVENSPALEDE